LAVKPLASARGRDDEAASADLAGALHEVSNTLTVVLGWLDAAKSETLPRSVSDAIEIALEHARLGHSIARRAIGAEVEDANAARSALSVARDSARGISQEAQRKRVTIKVMDRATDDLLVTAAPVAQQILINLLLNAVHFSPSDSRVVLGVERERDMMRFQVIDFGPGIAPDRVESLFQSPESTRRGGAGIGLRHAAALARAHGGGLSLVRTGPGGSEFELVWPIGEAPSCARRTLPPPTLGGLRVLLLEDDAAVSTLVDVGLTARGAEVASVREFGELTEVVRRGVFDVALLDLSPLGDDPHHALDVLEQRRPGLPIVIISGSVAPELDVPRIVAWVRKPFEVGELVDALTRIRPAG
jgi:CheY-like chemotaxis protein